MALERWVWLARIKRTQGRKGELFAEILTDFPEKFAERHRLWLFREPVSGRGRDARLSRPDSPAPRELELMHHWLHKGGIVLHFAGIDSISAAEELAGMVVAIPRAERADLEEGGVYISDLIGCVLVDIAGNEPLVVGEIEDVDRDSGPVAMLVVRPASQHMDSANQRVRDEEILIPFAKDFLRSVDLEAKRVEMALPDGLVELNRPERS
jgi:16S rRNA processing protein RimM